MVRFWFLFIITSHSYICTNETYVALRLDNQSLWSCSWPAVFHHLSGSAVPGLNSVAWGRLLAAGLQGAALALNRVAKNSTAFGAARCAVPTTLRAGKGRRSPGVPVDKPSLGGSAVLEVILQSLLVSLIVSKANLPAGSSAAYLNYFAI